MALAVLDGNQTATTLSSVVTGGEHIVAHSVVSLGSAAISNITSAVSGSVVSISNFPASQSTTFGAVTGSVSVLNLPSTQTIAGTVTANGGDGTFLVGGLRGGSKTAFPMDVGTGYLQTKVESMPAITGTVSATVTLGVVSQGCFGATIQGYDTLTGVAFSNCVPVKLFEDSTGLIGNVAGTVTANVPLSPDVWAGNDGIRVVGNGSDGALRIGGYDPSSGAQLNLEEGGGIPVFAVGQVALPISGTVTANGYDGSNAVYAPIPLNDGASAVNVRVEETNGSIPISGTVTVGNAQQLADTLIDQTSFYAPLQVSIQGAGADVPVALPKGALTTRFGSVTTANTAQITSAVTNTSRKYLLAQNISAGTVTIGIGFSPTTTQGIQLPAGGGLTFDAFCPTGAVYWLGAVTGAAFTILEG